MNNGLSCILLPREDDNSKETPAKWQSIANSSKVQGMALVFGRCYNFSINRTSSDIFFYLIYQLIGFWTHGHFIELSSK